MATEEPPNQPPDPARYYFRNNPVNKWSMIQYLNNNKEVLATNTGFSTLCDAWIRALTSIKNDPTTSDRRRKVATKLLNRYKLNGEDCRAARAARDLAQNEQAAQSTQSAIVVNGSNAFSNAFSNATISVNAPATSPSSEPEQPSTTNSRKRKRESKRPAAAPGFIKHFAESFKVMDNDRKWNLPSGGCVEDILYHHFKDAPKECAVHSWVVDTRDRSVKDCFCPEDWKAMCDEIPLLPDPDPNFVDAMLRYATFRTTDQLRDYLDTTPPFRCEELSSLSPDERHGRRWIDDVIRCWSKLCQTPGVFESNNKEFWYISNFWGPVFDQCMLTIKGSSMSRGESKSLCTSDRKNSRPRPPGRRRRVGHLYDGILKIGGHEVGAAEHARQFMSEKQNKWVSDTLKVVKVLHDMLYQLQLHVGGEAGPPGGLGRLQVIGVVTAGWRCQFLRMVYARGYICLLSGDDVREIPSCVENVSTLLELLGVLWRFRAVMNGCDAIINPAKTFTPEQLAEHLKKPSGRATALQPKSPPMIPRSVETDDVETDDSGGE